jgi:hypothetical protein
MDYFFSRKDYHQVNFEENLFFEQNEQLIPYFIDNELVKVPFRSSFFVLEKEINSEFLDNFIRSLKAKKIAWILPPIHFPLAKENFDLLTANQFKIKQIEITQYLDLSKDFVPNLNKSKKNKLNKLLKTSIQTRQLDFNYFDQCFDIIADTRYRKNYPLTMKKEDLAKLILHFPEDFLLFGTFIDNELAACSVTIKLSKSVIYHFYWGHAMDFNNKSPLLYHIYYLACEAKKWGFEIFDFGTSTYEGTINRGLFRFKKELGAKAVKKYYLERQL